MPLTLAVLFAVAHALTTEYRENPVGLETRLPRLGWQTDAGGQTSWCVLAASSPDKLAAGEGDFWDSGRCAGETAVSVPWSGRPLPSLARVWWKVMTWNKAGEPVGWSQPARFSVGFSDPSEWKAKWIKSACPNATPLFTRRFTVRPGLRRATLCVTGVGFHESYLNGRKIGDRVLDPSPTAYHKRVLYAVHEIEKDLREGENELGLLIGHGWYDARARAMWWFEKAVWRATPCGIAQLTLEYADGRCETVVTDSSWRQRPSPVGYDAIWEGEVIGAVSPDEPDYATTEVFAVETKGPSGRLEAQSSPPSRIVRELTPERIVDLGGGTSTVVFAENIAGWMRLKVRGQKRGDVLRFRYDERIGDGYAMATNREIHKYVYEFPSAALPGGPGAFQTDRYVCRGEDGETYEPRFTFSGFQYVHVSGLSAPLRTEDVRGCFVSTDFPETGSFVCSDERFNRLFDLTARTYRGNFTEGFPTDCPHREKLGWTGDAAIACVLAQYMFENTSGYEKWIRDLVDAQNEKGELPGVVPSGGWGYVRVNGPAWDCALMVVPWTLYVCRGDRRALEDACPAIERYMDYVMARFPDGLVNWGLKDWHPIHTETPVPVTATAYTYRNTTLAAKIARVLGKAERAAQFAAYAERVRTAFRETFVKDGVVSVGSQTAQSVALEFGLLDDAAVPAARARLIAAVKEAKDHFDVGIQGMNHVFRALSKAGQTDLAYRMLTQPDYPSPMSWLEKGATTLWDNWGDGDSRNHIMFGDFAAWAYQYLAGIRFNEDVSEPNRFVLAPEPIPSLDFVEASVETVCGRLRSSWRRQGGRVTYTFDVPFNATAEVILPGEKPQSVGQGRHMFVRDEL